MMRLYRVTVYYLTPTLRPSSFTDTYLAETPSEACEDARYAVRYEVKRKVRSIESCTCEPVRAVAWV